MDESYNQRLVATLETENAELQEEHNKLAVKYEKLIEEGNMVCQDCSDEMIFVFERIPEHCPSCEEERRLAGKPISRRSPARIKDYIEVEEK